MRRFNVKKNQDKTWKDKGPDLLRTRPNARKTIKSDMENYDGGWYRRQTADDGSWNDWKGPFSRAEVLDHFDGWSPANGNLFQWGRQQEGGGKVVHGTSRCRVFNVQDRANTASATDNVVALCEAAFPQGAYGGTFVCKQISGSSSWSQHAYGKAYDHSCYDDNDEATDWCVRMARENTKDDIVFPVNQVIGSKGGKAGVAQNPDGDWIGPFEWNPGGADDSHEWHVHLSCGERQSSGTPACA